eukprot:scaffold42819_cov78-Cyclotella_meneghiniana.AAC.2
MNLCGILIGSNGSCKLFGKPYIGDYINHVSQCPDPKTAKHAIVPTYMLLITQLADELLMTSRYAFNNTTTNPADRRAKAVISEYKSRFQILDKHYAPAVLVGDGNCGITGPFDSAQKQFHCDRVIPICVGAFGPIR